MAHSPAVALEDHHAARPRPTLKGESQVTVRLMDDIQIPRQLAQSNVRPTSYDRPRPYYRPQSFDRPPNSGGQPSSEPAQAVSPQDNSVPDVTYSAQIAAAQENQPAVSEPTSAQTGPSAPNSTRVSQPLRTKWIALKPGNVYAVSNYRIHEGSVTYVLSSGARGSVDVTEVDWRKTSHLNAEPIASSVATRAAVAGDAPPFSARH